MTVKTCPLCKAKVDCAEDCDMDNHKAWCSSR